MSEYRRDSHEIIAHIHNILWHMRGGVTREEAWTLSADERKNITKLIEDRVKIVEKTGLPLL